jgi:hypothetical protein
MASQTKGALGTAHLDAVLIAVGVFDPEQARTVTAAFDQTWLAVQDTGTPFASDGVAEATRDVLALRIIAMAGLGELDCDRLHEAALRYLAEMRGTATHTRSD